MKLQKDASGAKKHIMVTHQKGRTLGGTVQVDTVMTMWTGDRMSIWLYQAIWAPCSGKQRTPFTWLLQFPWNIKVKLFLPALV